MKNLVFFENSLIHSGTFVLLRNFHQLARLALGGGGILKRSKLDYALRLNIKKNDKIAKTHFFIHGMKKLTFFENSPRCRGTFLLIRFFQMLPILAVGGGGI